MSYQPYVKWHMRSILIDWLAKVHWSLNLLPETIHMCVHLLDRFLSLKVVSVEKFQLVGVTALYIAAKLEEARHPNVQDMLMSVDEVYTVKDFVLAERYMLHQLEFELGWPGPL